MIQELYKIITTFEYQRIVNLCSIVYPDGRESKNACFAEAKRPSGRWCELRAQSEDMPKAMTDRLGWTEELFDAYLGMLRDLNPSFIPMLEKATFNDPVVVLSSPLAKDRFICWCLFRLIWERPDAAHRLLLLYLSIDGFNLVNVSVFGALDYSIGGGHWYCYGPSKGLEEKLMSTEMDMDGAGGVDRWLGGSLPYNNVGIAPPDLPVEEFIQQWTKALGIKGGGANG